MGTSPATYLVMVLDRSGSMEKVREDTIGGFNTFLHEQQQLPDEALFTLAQFDNLYEIVHDAILIKGAPDLNRETFVPRGNTALLDAIGRSINSIEAKVASLPDPKPRVIVVILTDGYENASREFRVSTINDMITKCQAKGWQFLYLGADQDAITAAANLGIPSSHSLGYASTGQGTRNAFSDASDSVGHARHGGTGGFKSDPKSGGGKAN